jgi:hypothetical protein
LTTLEEGKGSMRRVIWAPVLAALLLTCGSAWAAPATVNLRVEGATSTIFEGPVTTDGKSITKGGNTVVCDGTSNPGNSGPGPTATSALDDGAIAGGFTWDASFGSGDFFVNAIAGELSNSTQFWGIALNQVPIDVGGCGQQVVGGDEVLFAFDFFQPDFTERPTLSLDGPPKARAGQPVGLSVDEVDLKAPYPAPREFVRGPAAGVTVAGAETDATGGATVTFPASGLVRVKAERPGSIRSNALLICVSDTGTGDCGVPPGRLGTGGGAKVKDSSAPVARISGPRNGRRYRHGPRLLRGTASDVGSGVKQVKLALRKHVRGKGCQWWSGRRERFVGRNCHKKFFFAIGNDANWSYLLPRALGAGHYVLDVKVFDAAGNRADVFRRGQNRTVFDVGPPVAAKAAKAPAQVDVMVVGKRRVIVKPVTVRADETVVRASGRRCAVGASTPLAGLVAALARSKVAYSVRDFGSCSAASPRDSRQLFVKRIGRERNKGQNGWVYKVDDRAPNRGAADTRMRRGDRLVWLYCEQQPKSGGCQSTLRIVPAKRSGLAGESLRVRVLGFDDRRRKRPVPGATVSLTAARKEITSAVAAADGTALLTLPGAGTYELAATAPGLVPSFPVRIKTKNR